MEPSTYTEEDTIDLRELFSTIKRRKKILYLVTGLVTLIALIYLLMVTPWWQAHATIEIGKYTDNKTGEEIYLEKGSSVAEKLKIEYIDIYKNTNGRTAKILSVINSKKNPQFISISALGKSNTLAVKEINTMISTLQQRHQKIIEEIKAKKKANLDRIDRNIFQIKNYKMNTITDKINYIKKVELPSVDKKIDTVNTDLKNSLYQKKEALKNLTSLNHDAALAALRLAQIQGIEYQISTKQMQLIDLNSEKEKISTTILPGLQRKFEEFKNISLLQLKEERKLIELSMQSHNYHNTKLIGDVITQKHPAKPKKKLIMVVSFITGLMLSLFLIFFLEFLGNVKEEETTEKA